MTKERKQKMVEVMDCLYFLRINPPFAGVLCEGNLTTSHSVLLLDDADPNACSFSLSSVFLVFFFSYHFCDRFLPSLSTFFLDTCI
jgi:hypothetical protein